MLELYFNHEVSHEIQLPASPRLTNEVTTGVGGARGGNPVGIHA